MAGSTFWNSTELEPKRQFKFLLILPGAPDQPESGVETYLIKSVAKPSVTIATGASVQFMQHTFKYPGRLTWSDISVTLIDTVRIDDTSSRLATVIKNSGYVIPANLNDAQFSFSKRDATNALNKPRIQQIKAGDPGNDVSPEIIEEWTLWNAWVNSVNFGALDYSNDSIVNLTMGITYDWAEYTTKNPGEPLDYRNGGGLQQRGG